MHAALKKGKRGCVNRIKTMLRMTDDDVVALILIIRIQNFKKVIESASFAPLPPSRLYSFRLHSLPKIVDRSYTKARIRGQVFHGLVVDERI